MNKAPLYKFMLAGASGHIPFTTRCHESGADVTKYLPVRKKYEPWFELRDKTKET